MYSFKVFKTIGGVSLIWKSFSTYVYNLLQHPGQLNLMTYAIKPNDVYECMNADLRGSILYSFEVFRTIGGVSLICKSFSIYIYNFLQHPGQLNLMTYTNDYKIRQKVS